MKPPWARGILLVCHAGLFRDQIGTLPWAEFACRQINDAIFNPEERRVAVELAVANNNSRIDLGELKEAFDPAGISKSHSFLRSKLALFKIVEKGSFSEQLLAVFNYQA